MNRRSPGRSLVSWFAALPLAVSLAAAPVLPVSSAFADEGGEGVSSSVVAPKITKLSPIVKSEKPRMEEYPLPVKYSVPYGLAIDSKDRVWFTEMAGNSLAVFDPGSGELKEYRIPSTADLPEIEWEYDPQKGKTPDEVVNIYSVGAPGAISIDKNGVVWFVMQLGNRVVRFDPEKEEFIEFLVPTEASLPYDIAADGKGRVWFVEKNSGKFGYLDTVREKVAEIELGQGMNIMGITVDGGDNVWISEVNGNFVGRYNPETKTLKQFPVNIPNSQPGQLRFDKDGRLWICHLRSQHIGVLIVDPGVHSVVPLPGYNTVPQALAPDRENRIWVVDSMTNKVGFFHADELVWRMFNIPTAHSQPMNVAVDSKGDVWFTESDRHANQITRLVASTVPGEDVPAAGSKAPATVSGGDKKAGESMNMNRIYAAIVVIVAAAALAVFMLRRGRPGE